MHLSRLVLVALGILIIPPPPPTHCSEDEIARLVSELESGWKAYLKGVAGYDRVKYSYKSSNGTVEIEVARDENCCVYIQKDEVTTNRPSVGINDSYSFVVESIDNKYILRDLKIANDGEGQVPQGGTAELYSEYLSNGLLLIPDFVMYGDIDWRAPEWGLISVDLSDTPGRYLITFKPTVNSRPDEHGNLQPYGRIAGGEIEVDPQQNWLPVSGKFDMKMSEQERYSVKAEWEYGRGADGEVLIKSQTFLTYGEPIPDSDPDPDIRYRASIYNIRFEKGLAPDEFLLSRFGLAEPVVGSDGVAPGLIVLGCAGLAVLFVAVIAQRRLRQTGRKGR